MRAFAVSAVFLLCTWASPANAAKTVLVSEGRERVALQPWIEILYDPQGSLRIDDVISEKLNAGFKSTSAQLFNVAGYRQGAYWLRFCIQNDKSRDVERVLEVVQSSNEAKLYTETPGGGFVAQAAGGHHPFYARAVPYRNVNFLLSIKSGERQCYHVRLAGDDSMLLELALWTELGLYEEVTRETTINSVYYGIIASMAVYNLFIFVSTLEMAYFYYVIFQTFIGFLWAVIDMSAFHYLWPNHGWLNVRVEIAVVAIVLIGAIGFAQHFLDLRNSMPSAWRLLRVLMAPAALLGLCSFFTSQLLVQQVGVMYVMVVSTTLFGVGLYAWSKRLMNARIFSIAWGIFLGSTIIDSVSNIGWLPVYFLPVPKIGSAAEALLLSMALANRINIMRRANEKAQAELLNAQRTHTLTLERRVSERTQELSEALTTLTQTQGRMMQQARMAALGHLVSGVAHEIGNPLNYILSGAREALKRLDIIEQGYDLAPGNEKTAGAEPMKKAISGARRAGRVVMEGGERIKIIVDNLRRYAASKDVSAVPTDLVAELKTTLDLFGERLAKHSINVELDLEPLPSVPCRPGEISQIFTNVVVNSFYAMSGGGTLRIRAKREGDFVKFTFSDTGPGVAPEHRSAIFDPFFTTRSPGEGTGLGLSISLEIAKRHGGQLWLAEGGEGATFVLSLPLSATSGTVD